MLIDHSNGRVLDVLKSREKQVIRAYLERGRTSGLLAQVLEVTTELNFEHFRLRVLDRFGVPRPT